MSDGDFYLNFEIHRILFANRFINDHTDCVDINFKCHYEHY